MSTGYPLPPETFNAGEWARNKVLRANQGRQKIYNEFLELYHDFWGVSQPGGGSRHTVAEMQEAIDKMPPDTALKMMDDSDRLKNFILSVAPNSLDPWYLDTAFETTIIKEQQPDGTEKVTITIGDLRPAWRTVSSETI